jgi:hypothetical protein
MTGQTDTGWFSQIVSEATVEVLGAAALPDSPHTTFRKTPPGGSTAIPFRPIASSDP